MGTKSKGALYLLFYWGWKHWIRIHNYLCNRPFFVWQLREEPSRYSNVEVAKKCVYYMFLLFIAFRIHAKFSNRQTDNIIVELHIKIRKKDIILVGKAKQKNIFCAYPDVTHQLFLALILISNMSWGKLLPHIATKAIKTTSKAPTFVLVAAPLPRFLKRHKAC